MQYKIDSLYKKIDKIESDLTEEYKDGETVWASQLEITKERLEKTICFLESAVDLLQNERGTISEKPLLADVIKSAEERSKNSENIVREVDKCTISK